MNIKLALVFVALMLMFVGAASSESVKVNGFSVSFDLNQTHDTVVDNGNGINGSAAIRTFDGDLALKSIDIQNPWQ